MYNNIWCNFVISLIFIVAVIDPSDIKEKIKISGSTKSDTYEYDHESTADFVCSYEPSTEYSVNITWIWQNKDGNQRNLSDSKNSKIQVLVGEKNAGDNLTCVAIEIPTDNGDIGGSDQISASKSISFKYNPPASSTVSSSPASYTETADAIGTSNDLEGENKPNQNNIIYIACGVFILIFLAILVSWLTSKVIKKKRIARSTNEEESVHNTTVNTKSLTKTNGSDQTRLAKKKYKEPEVNEVYSEVKDSIDQSIYTAPQSVYSDANTQMSSQYAVVLPKNERNKNRPKDNLYTYANPSCSYTPRKNYVNIISDKSKYVNFETNGRNVDYCNAYESIRRNVKDETGYYEADYL